MCCNQPQWCEVEASRVIVVHSSASPAPMLRWWSAAADLAACCCCCCGEQTSGKRKGRHEETQPAHSPSGAAIAHPSQHRATQTMRAINHVALRARSAVQAASAATLRTAPRRGIHAAAAAATDTALSEATVAAAATPYQTRSLLRSSHFDCSLHPRRCRGACSAALPHRCDSSAVADEASPALLVLLCATRGCVGFRVAQAGVRRGTRSRSHIR